MPLYLRESSAFPGYSESIAAAAPPAAKPPEIKGPTTAKQSFAANRAAEPALPRRVFFPRPRSGLKENSPALQRWGDAAGSAESVKRTTE